MKKSRRQFGFTLFELITIAAVVAALVAVMIPSVRAMRKSYESTGAEGMIAAALSSAQAIAAKEHRYAGVRFQMEMNPDTTKWPTGLNQQPFWKASQYMIFIINADPADMGNLTTGFKVVEGLKPIKLPDNVGVMDLMVRTGAGNTNTSVKVTDPSKPGSSAFRSVKTQITDMTSFSVVFSPSGKLVTKEARVRNKDGMMESSESAYRSNDDVFNTRTKIYNATAAQRFGRFVQDDYPAPSSANPALGLGPEMSRGSFVIFDKEKFWGLRDKRVDNDNRQNQYKYLMGLKLYYVNPYSGAIN